MVSFFCDTVSFVIDSTQPVAKRIERDYHTRLVENWNRNDSLLTSVSSGYNIKHMGLLVKC